jgi:hypothetical protein
MGYSQASGLREMAKGLPWPKPAEKCHSGKTRITYWPAIGARSLVAGILTLGPLAWGPTLRGGQQRPEGKAVPSKASVTAS